MPAPGRRLAGLGGVLALELAGLALVYQVLTPFECAATGGAVQVCALLRSAVARAITLLAAGAVLVWARPAGVERLLRAGPGGRGWLGLHGAGLLLILAPLVVTGGADLGGAFDWLLLPWLAGGLAAAAGALLWLAPPRAWADWVRAERGLPLGVGLGALLAPEVAERTLPLWNLGALTDVTFGAVHGLLRLAGAEPQVFPDEKMIALDGFLVHIAEYCSGVEGFVLVSGFVLLYGLLFRAELRVWRYWLLVLPVALLTSWGLNVVRLAALVAIGARVSPELAIGGFHSYAGWMFFTLLALGFLAGVRAVPVLHGAGAPPSRRAWTMPGAEARILPFVAFMLASVLVPAFSPVPDLAYPVKVVAMAGALAAFTWRRETGLGWGLDPVAVAAGLGVGLLWIATRPAPGDADLALARALHDLGPGLLVAWIVFRLAGTVLLVPVVEELFFRGYVLARIDGIGIGTDAPGGLGRRIAAIAVSSLLFGLLHGRWLVAGAAGVVFALVSLRRGRLADAIVAHALANLVVAGFALLSGDWAAI